MLISRILSLLLIWVICMAAAIELADARRVPGPQGAASGDLAGPGPRCELTGLLAEECDCYVVLFVRRYPPADPPSPELEPITDYVARYNPKIDAGEVAQVIIDCAEEQGLDPWLLTAVARFESTFDMDIRGPCGIDSNGERGERGLLQVHPVHEDCFEEAGCIWGDRVDVVRFGAMMMRVNLEKGWSLRRALGPWVVRDKALAVYRRMERATGTGWEIEGGSDDTEEEEDTSQTALE